MILALALSFLIQTDPCGCPCPKTEPIQLATAGKITGTVRLGDDPLPGTTLTLRGEGMTLTVVSDAEGGFTFFNVPPGLDYRLRAELFGVKTAEKKHIAIAAGTTTDTSFKMRWDESQMICVDCGNAQPMPPDGPSFTITREMMDTIPIR